MCQPIYDLQNALSALCSPRTCENDDTSSSQPPSVQPTAQPIPCLTDLLDENGQIKAKYLPSAKNGMGQDKMYITVQDIQLIFNQYNKTVIAPIIASIKAASGGATGGGTTSGATTMVYTGSGSLATDNSNLYVGYHDRVLDNIASMSSANGNIVDSTTGLVHFNLFARGSDRYVAGKGTDAFGPSPFAIVSDGTTFKPSAVLVFPNRAYTADFVGITISSPGKYSIVGKARYNGMTPVPRIKIGVQRPNGAEVFTTFSMGNTIGNALDLGACEVGTAIRLYLVDTLVATDTLQGTLSSNCYDFTV